MRHVLFAASAPSTDCAPHLGRIARPGRDLVGMGDATLTGMSSAYAFEHVAGAESASSQRITARARFSVSSSDPEASISIHSMLPSVKDSC